MACNTCSTKVGIPKGCRSNGTCSSGGCDKMEVHDWLANMSLPGDQEPFYYVEIRFKNGRKAFYHNDKKLPLHIGEMVVVDVSPGYDVGLVSLTGELVRMQMRRRNSTTDNPEMKNVIRKATQRDLDIFQEARSLEETTMHRAREMSHKLGLEMKLSDVEYQGDKTKATFYYTAEDRVDFRQLIKDMASAFKVKIEMRQIGARQEAARLGGIGSCGRELCCSTWLTDFRTVNTSAARYQQLSLNPQKLAGQCGKLKCCLNYELDSYMDALKAFPETNKSLKTKRGEASFQKMDIFGNLMWYSYNDEPYRLITMPMHEVKRLIELNNGGTIPENLEEFSLKAEVSTEPQFKNVVGQDSLNRFDSAPKGKKRNKNKKRRNKQGRSENSQG
jgi:cell fate regulator YaaT (PSP1 superfamily)